MVCLYAATKILPVLIGSGYFYITVYVKIATLFEKAVKSMNSDLPIRND